MPSPLELLRRVIMTSRDMPDFLEAFNHIRRRSPNVSQTNEWNKVTLPDEMASNMQHPDVRTHVFFDADGRAQGAYQLDSRAQVPYLLSDMPGLGAHLLDDAYFVAPQKPLSLHAIPGSEGFYRKQPGWVESQEDGISKFTKKAHGGLVQMKECSCGTRNR